MRRRHRGDAPRRGPAGPRAPAMARTGAALGAAMRPPSAQAGKPVATPARHQPASASARNRFARSQDEAVCPRCPPRCCALPRMAPFLKQFSSLKPALPGDPAPPRRRRNFFAPFDTLGASERDEEGCRLLQSCPKAMRFCSDARIDAAMIVSRSQLMASRWARALLQRKRAKVRVMCLDALMEIRRRRWRPDGTGLRLLDRSLPAIALL